MLEGLGGVYSAVSEYVTWTAVATYSGIAMGTWLFHFLFIKPFMSPLRQIPGLPYRPIVGNMKALMKGEAMEATIGFVEQYGPVCRYYFYLGLERLLVADPPVMKYILVTNCKNYIKPPSRFFLMKMVLGETGLVMSEGNLHRTHKKLISPGFNQLSLQKMLCVFEHSATTLTANWKAKVELEGSKAEVDVNADLCRLTLDIIGRTAFGYEFNAQNNPNHEMTVAFQRLLTGAGLSWKFMIPLYYKLPFPESRRMKHDLNLMWGTVQNIIKSKRQALHDGADVEVVSRDVLGTMMLARDEATGRGLSDQELQDEVMTIMLAGHETTAAAISWSLLALAEHPEIQQKLREEIQSVLPPEGIPITWEHLEEMQYCDCVVKETLRMFPPVPLTLRQALESDVLDGKYAIPKGTIILLSMGPMMRSPDLFNDPNTFKPERFLQEEANSNLYKFLPFLIGPRMCLGYKFAQLEMKLVLALVLREMQVLPLPGVEYKRRLRLTMRPDPLLRLLITKA